MLGEGELTKKLSVTVHGVLGDRREKIEAAGGTVTLLKRAESRRPKKKHQGRGARARPTSPRWSRPTRRRGRDAAARARGGRGESRVAHVLLARQRVAGPGAPAPGAVHGARCSPPTGSARGCRRRASTRDRSRTTSAARAARSSACSTCSRAARSRGSRSSRSGSCRTSRRRSSCSCMTVVDPEARAAAEGGRGGLREDQPVHALPHGRPRRGAGAGYAYLFKQPGRAATSNARAGMVLIVVTLTAGTTLLMWMGELITKRGIGNGISILIFASILAAAPAGINAWSNGGPMEKLFFPLVALGDRRRGRLRPGGPAPDPDPVREADGGPAADRRRLDLHAAPREHGRRHPDHLRGRDPGVPADDRRSSSRRRSDFINAHFPPCNWAYLLLEGVLIVDLHLLLHGGAVQPGRPGRQPAQVRRLHPGHPARPADGAVPRPRADAADAARLALPGGHRRAARHLHPLRRLLAGDLARPRRHLGADRRRRRARHHAADGVADDDALLRGLPRSSA